MLTATDIEEICSSLAPVCDECSIVDAEWVFTGQHDDKQHHNYWCTQCLKTNLEYLDVMKNTGDYYITCAICPGHIPVTYYWEEL